MFTVLALSAVLLIGISISGRSFNGPQCLGPYCLDSRVTARNLAKALGLPPRRSDTTCYKSERGSSFVFILADEANPGLAVAVFLSDFANCLHIPVRRTAKDLAGWKTREGIGLGSSEADVLKAYGKPSDVWRPSDYTLVMRGYVPGDRVPKMGALVEKAIRYKSLKDSELLFSEFGIRNGKVSYIYLNENE